MEQSSISLAIMYNRNHKEILRTIRRRLNEAEYQKTTYLDVKNERRTMYIVSEEGCMKLFTHHIQQMRHNKLKKGGMKNV